MTTQKKPDIKKIDLNTEQKLAYNLLEGESNLFLTGAAGSGKSTVIREFLKTQDPKACPVLASTGAAAILIGGRTFHSFFGIGILEGGPQATVERALKNKRLVQRLRDTESVIIDEVSMLSGVTLATAEQIARLARANDSSWGGLKIIAVGDFSQLPPVNPYGSSKDWAFLHDVWYRSDFEPVFLRKNMRTTEDFFIKVLNQIRRGEMDNQVEEFLDARTQAPPLKFDGTRLFARKEDVEKLNHERLSQLSGVTVEFNTEYGGKKESVENFKRNAPIPDVLSLKEGALIMMRQNDPERKWVNGSLGILKSIEKNKLHIHLKSGRDVEIEKSAFTLLDAEGEPVATATNFPVQLAWAVTIHKAQGSTLDELTVDLRRLWEPGHAYVAMSRAKSAEGLYIEGWHPNSFKVDPQVRNFEERLESDFPDPEKHGHSFSSNSESLW